MDEVVSFAPGTSTTSGSSIAQEATGIADLTTMVKSRRVEAIVILGWSLEKSRAYLPPHWQEPLRSHA